VQFRFREGVDAAIAIPDEIQAGGFSRLLKRMNHSPSAGKEIVANRPQPRWIAAWIDNRGRSPASGNSSTFRQVFRGVCHGSRMPTEWLLPICHVDYCRRRADDYEPRAKLSI
jgi:hypothetical protein